MSRKEIKRRPRRRQRDKTCDHRVDDAWRVIWESMDHICAERLTSQLVPIAQHLAAHGELRLSDDLLGQLGRVRVSTVRRRLQKITHLEFRPLPRRPRPKQRNPFTRDVPVERISWDEQELGHLEVDLVQHCRASASGHYVHTVQMIDVATGWSERAATLGRGQVVMEDAFARILARLPFPVCEMHPDNGSEFFRDLLIRCLCDTKAISEEQRRQLHNLREQTNPRQVQKPASAVSTGCEPRVWRHGVRLLLVVAAPSKP